MNESESADRPVIRKVALKYRQCYKDLYDGPPIDAPTAAKLLLWHSLGWMYPDIQSGKIRDDEIASAVGLFHAHTGLDANYTVTEGFTLVIPDGWKFPHPSTRSSSTSTPSRSRWKLFKR